MSLATRAARAIFRGRIPTPIPPSISRSHSCNLISNHRRYHHIFQPDRSHFPTFAGTQAPEIPTAPWLVRSTIPRGDSSMNTADRIQDELEKNGHRVWGFVIYRCTYGDDAAWEECLERLNASMRDDMQCYNGLDLLEGGCYKRTVIAGARFNGVKTQYVREHFKEWRKQAILEEQGSPEEIEARRRKPEPRYLPYGEVGLDEEAWARSMQEVDLSPPNYVLPHLLRPRPERNPWTAEAVRYRFCLQIDEAAMRSIISPEADSWSGNTWVNLIEADWHSKNAATEFEEAWVDHVDLGLDKDSFDFEVEIYPEIDGCIEKNTGWMKVPYDSLIPAIYADSIAPWWLDEYMYWRPPTVLPTVMC